MLWELIVIILKRWLLIWHFVLWTLTHYIVKWFYIFHLSVYGCSGWSLILFLIWYLSFSLSYYLLITWNDVYLYRVSLNEEVVFHHPRFLFSVLCFHDSMSINKVIANIEKLISTITCWWWSIYTNKKELFIILLMRTYT